MINVKNIHRLITVLSLIICLTPDAFSQERSTYLIKHSVWLFPDQVHSDFLKVRDMARSLESAGLLRVFLMAGRVGKSGNLIPVKPENVRWLRKVLSNWNSDMSVIPWIGYNTKRLPLKNLLDAKNFSSFLSELKGILKIAGGDEVHLDIEPIEKGGESLKVLRLLKSQLKGYSISLAVPGPPPSSGVVDHGGIYYLEMGFLKKLCSIADELVVMFYDTGIYKKKDYIDYVRDTLVELTIAGGVENCSVTAGVPAYYSPSIKHNPAVENTWNAISGIKEALKDPRFYFPAFGGIAVYRYSLIDGKEKKVISEFTATFKYRQ